MKIIKLTAVYTEEDIYIFPEHIQYFHKVGEGTCVVIDNYNTWYVKEIPEEILKLINE